ncbi:hypothetical protein D9619_002627 [Psilocybe cf. subviscida]|uniref:Acyl-CoA desaturase n=1 Tax=Psilocybe cf. subviscida TaxID=2480587 RepID=A0A8H5ETV1_9AGAR|nr:hypothetical protein D9619_002627 [Psilocybe cf. subviscida]
MSSKTSTRNGDACSSTAVALDESSRVHSKPQKPPQIWWANAIFFVMVHVAAGIGMYYVPPWSIPRATLLLWFLTWQLSDFGITIGYHRLYSHKAFRAALPVRIVLAALGSAAFQGSIKIPPAQPKASQFAGPSNTDCTMLRFTDDLLHDPYAATRGLFYSHMGWIFYKPTYEKMELIERDDLERDPVVRFQHKHYVPLAIFFGFILPTLLGLLWSDPLGSYIYGGLVARLFIWHCTFLVNSLAHWEGLQPYSDEDTSRGNLLLALLTGGEGNHNFHSFPHDFRSGPSWSDWDPSKWIILGLEWLGLVTSLRRARQEDLVEAVHHMHHKTNMDSEKNQDEDEMWDGDVYTLAEIQAMAKEGRCMIVIDGFAVDVTSYLLEHPGGATLLRNYSVRLGTKSDLWKNSDWAFHGGLNNHSRAARRRMIELRVAKMAA